MRGNQLIGWLLAMALGVATFAGWLAVPHARGLDPLVIGVLWLNIILILVPLGIEVGRRPYSLNSMHLISMFLFLGAASILQYSRGVLGVPGPISNVQPQILPAAAATTFWMTGYLTAYEFRQLGRPPRATFLNRNLTISRVFLLGAFAVVALVYLAGAGMLGAATRGAGEAALTEFSETAGAGRLAGSLFILSANLARSLPPVALLAALLVLIRDPRTVSAAAFPFVAVIGIGTVAVNNPFAASRMFFTASLIAFVAPFFLQRLKTAWLLVVLVLMGLAILPSLGTATSRLALELKEVLAAFELGSPLQYLAANSDVDSLGMTALCQKWVDLHGHRWGMQILGAFLFWVPRVLWPSKPIGTGTMVTEGLGFDFTNLSPPITAEALVNFGLAGDLLIGAIFGWILSRLDAAYWAAGRDGVAKSYRILDALYPFWLGCMVYFTRGDLFPAMTFTVSFSIWILPLGLGLAAYRGATPAPGKGSQESRGVVGRWPQPQ